MATILNGDIQVDYLADNRKKRLSWLGGTNLSYTMNELYSAMATLLDETTTIDDGTCFSAETGTEYTIGKIDTGDAEPWYVTYDLMEKITGGALRTSGWERVTSTNTGIICVPVSPGGTIVAADEGNDITGATTGAGTLLEFIDTGGTYDYCFIRPDSSGAGDDFTTASQVLTCNANTATQWSTAASTTGEQIWTNVYSIGTIDANVHVYLYQGVSSDDTSRVRRFSWNDATQDWYGNGHINTTVTLKDIDQATWAIIDGGYITAFARKVGDYGAHFEVANSTTSGGRNPIPLQTSADIDNTTGIKKELTGTWTGTYVNAEIITGGTSGARGIVDIANSTSGTHLVYFPIDDPQVDFSSAETITGTTSGATSTSSGTPADYGPADSAWFTSATTPTIAFTYAAADVNDDTTNENYGISINCQANPLTEVYEWVKYATRNGEITNDLDNINGERYIGGEVYLAWTGTITGTMSEGADVTQATTGATGVIMAIDATAKVMLLRDVRGTFNTSNVVTDNDNSGTVTPDSAATAFAPKSVSPLGTFAGGTFFGARGVLLTNYLSADTNSFILTPIEGGTKQAPTSITLTVTNLSGGAATSNLHDRVSMFRLGTSGGIINKTEYNCSGGEAVGANTITVGSSIAQDVPGKANGGVLILVDDPAGTGDEYKLRYSSWSGSVFTLNEITGTATAGTGTTTLVDSGATFTDGADQVYRGDLVNVPTRGWSYVKTVDSDTQLTLTSAIAGFVSTDAYEINTTPVAITSADDIYVPFMDRIATAASESVSMVYSSTTYYRAKVRNTRASTKIKPFSVDGTISGVDVSIPTIRTTDTIIT